MVIRSPSHSDFVKTDGFFSYCDVLIAALKPMAPTSQESAHISRRRMSFALESSFKQQVDDGLNRRHGRQFPARTSRNGLMLPDSICYALSKISTAPRPAHLQA